MFNLNRATAIITGVLVLVTAGAHAQTVPEPDPVTAATSPQPLLHGWRLVSDDERGHYRATMRGLETPEERDRLRRAIHEAMKIRARERGLTLPDEPPARGGRHFGVHPRIVIGAFLQIGVIEPVFTLHRGEGRADVVNSDLPLQW